MSDRFNRVYISWKQYDKIIHDIVDKINKLGHKYKLIGTFSRGGLVPAAHLANLLGVKTIKIMHNYEMKTYMRDDQILMVDDISDSGKTLQGFEKFDIACVCHKKMTAVRPNFSGGEYKKDDWIIFPWESNSSREVRDRDTNDEVEEKEGW